MPRQFIHYSDEPFRDELLKSHILPAATWLLGEPQSPYLLPQYAGSIWECALSTNYLIHLVRAGVLDEETERLVAKKTLETARWLLEQAIVADDVANWDRALWDSAVCLRALMNVAEFYAAELTATELARVDEIVESCTRWLMREGVTWDTNARYVAGPADLAQAMHTLVMVARNHPDTYQKCQLAESRESITACIPAIARILLAQQTVESRDTPDGTLETSCWVDSFNTSEVMEAFTEYLRCSRESSVALDAPDGQEDLVREAVVRGIRHIELSQADGTWGGVADTVGTLYAYLRAVKNMPELDGEDHIIFKALRWMCDEKQALDDGSFLHTGYATVFYALALSQIYTHWELGARPVAEVYDVALWDSIASPTAERSRRIELEFESELREARAKALADQLKDLKTGLAAGTLLVVSMAGLVAVLVIFGVAKFSLDLEILKTEQFWTVVGIAVPVVPAAIGGFIAYRNRA